MRRMLIGIAFTLGGLGITSPWARSQPAPPSTLFPNGDSVYRVPRLDHAITVDGVLDDEGWRQALAVEFGCEISPGENTPAPVGTEFLIGYDQHHLYLAFRAFDPEPGAIRAHFSDRDRLFRDDFVGVMFDTFNDKRRGYEFFVNPLGVQGDLARNEVGSDNSEDETWDAIWDSAGRITAQGYEVEIAVPWSSLRFPPSDGEQTWRLTPFRSLPRSLRHQIALPSFDRADNCFFCQLPQFVGFAGVTPGRNVELDPTLTGERADAIEDPDDLRSPFVPGAATARAGISARWGITHNVSLNAALNPDFSQVEADSAQLAVNTRFALFYPEKRPFFMEGKDFFATPLSAVYTRTVADPSWGAKVTGKEGSNAFGVFVARDRITNLVIPSNQGSSFDTIEHPSTTAVVRWRHDLGESSTIGALLTDREGDGYANRTVGADALLRLTPTDTVTLQALTSRTRYPDSIVAGYEQPSGTFAGSAFVAGYTHSSRNWNWWVWQSDKGRDFRADTGFEPRVDVRTTELGLERIFWGGKDRWFSRAEVGVEPSRSEDHSGRLTDQSVTMFAEIEGPMQSTLLVRVTPAREFYDGATYDLNKFSAFFNIRPSGSFTTSIDVTLGDAIDYVNSRPATVTKIAPGLTWDIGRRLYFQLDHVFEDLEVDGGRLYRANLTQARLVYQLSLRSFLRLIVQRLDLKRNLALYDEPPESNSRQLLAQVMFSYKINPQTVFYLGSSDGRAGREDIPLGRTSRTYFVKFGYAWLL